ncbi:DegQ family serine endoprotease [Propionivibrio dicarboxylicus]|uniref:Probable periplasmic serine endoprotease DegP-like n=1 Tax=Propionivibrio dicarboxylicus TaxID=83767 RepID=A0A1G8E8J6_9RHOO|nr:DegQ family serine endoprotease [Propionivibrio dicarboxylicus]SDH66268.1 serine protease Do [Propionivibrio dicarboxylicus]
MVLRTLKRSVIAAVLTSLALASYSLIGGRSFGDAHAASTAAVPATAPAPVVATPLPDMSAIVARNGAAVVNISMSGKTKSGGDAGFSGVDPNDPFYEFFRHFRIPQQRGEQRVRGQGSGFIIREDGLVLTNAHVIDGADEVIVKLTDKREFKAKVLGADKATDVAVLRIDGKNLPTVKIGNSAATRVGEWVLAIGSPFGFENSATAGIISAKSRSLPDDSYVPFIQTDVAVNPGNSGGPLFNMAGEVVGINSQIYSRTGGYQGLSFAIPIDVAMSVQDQIVKHGKVQRGRLGITIQEVNQSLADSFGLSKPTGALVSSVEGGSPAAKAGLEPGDVILSLNGKEVSSSSELPPLVAAIRPGDGAKLQVWRKGASREIEVKVGSQKEEKLASGESKESAATGRLGLAVRSLTAEERRQNDGKAGLRVENASGAAARAGIRPGDVVLAVNGEPVTTPEQLKAIVGKAGKRVALLIQRDEARLFVPVDLN